MCNRSMSRVTRTTVFTCSLKQHNWKPPRRKVTRAISTVTVQWVYSKRNERVISESHRYTEKWRSCKRISQIHWIEDTWWKRSILPVGKKAFNWNSSLFSLWYKSSGQKIPPFTVHNSAVLVIYRLGHPLLIPEQSHHLQEQHCSVSSQLPVPRMLLLPTSKSPFLVLMLSLVGRLTTHNRHFGSHNSFTSANLFILRSWTFFRLDLSGSSTFSTP